MENGKYRMYFDGGSRVVGVAIYGSDSEVDIFYSRDEDIKRLENRLSGEGLVTIVQLGDGATKMVPIGNIRKDILSRRHPVKDPDFKKFNGVSV